MCCDSGHKTLPVLTGGAYLHLGPKAPVQEETAVRNALALFGSTSPSYLILQSLDRCNRYLSEGYPLRLYSCCGQLTRMRRVLNEQAAAAGCPLPLAVDDPAREPLKLTLDAAALGMTGTALAEALRQDRIECEYADPRYVVLMFTPANPPQDFERLTSAVARLCAALPSGPRLCRNRKADVFTELAAEAAPVCTVRQAVFAPQELIPAANGAGPHLRDAHRLLPAGDPHRGERRRIGPAALKLFRTIRHQKLSQS